MAFRSSPYPKQSARASLFSPRLVVADPSNWATSLLGGVVQCVICLFYLFIFSSLLCCPLRFQNSSQTHQWEGFLVFGNFSFMTPSLGWVSIPNSFVSLFIFYILSYLLSKTMAFIKFRFMAQDVIYPGEGSMSTWKTEYLRSKNLQAINAGEGVEKREPSYTVGGNAN